jgi:hypothetical protein
MYNSSKEDAMHGITGPVFVKVLGKKAALGQGIGSRGPGWRACVPPGGTGPPPTMQRRGSTQEPSEDCKVGKTCETSEIGTEGFLEGRGVTRACHSPVTSPASV